MYLSVPELLFREAGNLSVLNMRGIYCLYSTGLYSIQSHGIVVFLESFINVI